MHIDDCTYTRGGKTYRRVLLRNSYRINGVVRHDTIANLSHCSEEEIVAIKLALKNKGKLDKLGTLENMTSEQGLSVGAVWAFFQIAKQIGLTKVLGPSRNAMLVLWLIFATLIAQGSRLSAVRLAQQHAVCDILGLDSFNEDDLYSSMDWLDEQQGTIEQSLFDHRYGGENKAPNLFLYDVTSSYLEGSQNELAQYGYNRDKKNGKTQIVIGLLTDNDGRPISIEVFDGNTQDPQTVASQIEKLQKRFAVEKVTLVGDRGMLKSAQIDALQSFDFNYITAITKPQIHKLVKDNVIQYSFFDENIMEVLDDGVRYVLRRNPIRAEEMARTRDNKLKKLHEFINKQNNYLEEHPRAQMEVAVRKVQEKIKKFGFENWAMIHIEVHVQTPEPINVEDKNTLKSIEIESIKTADENTKQSGTEKRILIMSIDEGKKKDLFILDGCYVIKSNVPVEFASAQTVHDRYKDLAMVEKAFRTMKTTLLEMRGIFVRKENRTRAHVFIIMLAYLIAFELHNHWYDVETTVKEGIFELTQICSVHLTIAGHSTTQVIPNPRPLGKTLLEKLKITLPDALPHRNVTVDTRKKLVSSRKAI